MPIRKPPPVLRSLFLMIVTISWDKQRRCIFPFICPLKGTRCIVATGFDYGVARIPATNTIAINDWQISLLAKYEAGSGPIRPFIDAGFAYRHVSLSYRMPFGPVNADNPNTAGFTMGAGITLKPLFFRISPKIRYAHWPTSPFESSPWASGQANQVDFLLGLTF